MQNFEKKNNITNLVVSDTKRLDFNFIYNRICRISSAVFLIANSILGEDDLKGQIKNMSLKLVSVSVGIKDSSISDSKKMMSDIEKISLELMSLFNIASVSGFVSEMNSNILREEFNSFIKEISSFYKTIDENTSLKSLVSPINYDNNDLESNIDNNLKKISSVYEHNNIGKSDLLISGQDLSKKMPSDELKNQKRKEVRKDTIYEFIKRHENSSIKDILPNIVGCSEKTIQRELISLINEGKIRKIGERRWSKYSVV